MFINNHVKWSFQSLPEDKMQKIASEMNLSETVYIIDRHDLGFIEGQLNLKLEYCRIISFFCELLNFKRKK